MLEQPRCYLKRGDIFVKRIKLLLATIAAMAVMLMAVASPALANHGWWFSDWWRWQDTNWWCYSAWEHTDAGWDFVYVACWHTEAEVWWISD